MTNPTSDLSEVGLWSNEPKPLPTPWQRNIDFGNSAEQTTAPWKTPLRQVGKIYKAKNKDQETATSAADPAASLLEKTIQIRQFRTMAYAIEMRSTRYEKRNPRRHDPNGQPYRFKHGSEPHHPFHPYECRQTKFQFRALP